MVAQIIKLKECIDEKKSFQSKGDVVTYYLKIENKNLNIVKFDADCIKDKLKITHRIGDTFFNISKGGGEQKVEKWILVETKGKGNDYFEQLEKSLSFFDDANCSIHGRYIGRNVPAILKSNERKAFDKLQQKFIAKKGTLYIRNRNVVERIFDINKMDFEK
jgi:hypothetical protein